ncbi:hypothetical protein SAMN05421780_107140 [Flexibacter flexilis DSM 6793]|uniref:Nucleotide-diphospho-sugar transferase n=1 Tax=Flexibacter flexilis DSM 6793 TaxID=927664 RepID=A0A1I1KPR1_9BACT|nr:hypothetical protein [Flexibacter flexilis]SFC62272.1 hypothetical protein SAMN05421780_107140 [Flexibacter flexilis DSM 6793]
MPTTQPNYWIMQAYGHVGILNEAKYALLSFLAGTPADKLPQIIIYTDQPAFFKLFEHYVTFKAIDKQLIKEWSGEINFVHRVKIKMLQDFWATHTHGNLLYTDTDVTFLKSVPALFEAIEQGTFLMHVSEGAISPKSNLTISRLYKFFKTNPKELAHFWAAADPTTLQMYNAGVLGMNSGMLLEDVLRLTDDMYKIFERHIVEQFAFSYYAQTKAPKLMVVNDFIFHYWNFKEFRGVLADFFTKYEGESLQKLIALHTLLLPQDMEKPKRAYEALSFLPRTLRKLSGKRWTMPPYRF